MIDYPSDAADSTSNPDIIDASPVTTREILVLAGLGSHHGDLEQTGQRTFYNVTVDLNVDPLKRCCASPSWRND